MIHRKSLTKVLPLLLIILIDSMGMGLLIPSLTAIMIIPQQHNIASHLQPDQRQMWYGVIMSTYMLAWFFSASILGDLSDQVGRKKILSLCMAGSIIAFSLTGIAATVESLTLLIISRILGGLIAGSQAIAQAAIIDVSDADSKAQHLGLIIMTASVGYIAGPLLGGILSDHHLSSWFFLYTPFYFAALQILLYVIIM